MKISISTKFLGGVADGDNLTGSCTLITIRRGKNLTKFLIDAGLVQCEFKNSVERNQAILTQLDPLSIDFIITTHSHIDHIGRIPLLVKEGFCGRIICTKPTKRLMRVMLTDTAKIQASENKFLKTREKKREKRCREKHHRRNYKQKREEKIIGNKPLYGLEDVERTCELIKNGGFEYEKWIKLSTGISLKFYPSGHVLGGAICVVKIMRPKTTKHLYLGFSGDLGREDGIILPAPVVVKEPIKNWFIESTYGGKIHPERDEEINKLLDLVVEAKERKQKIIIPSFALERTQEIIYLLSCYMHRNIIPKIPIYLDSPMALEITRVYADHWNSKMFKDQSILQFNAFDAESANKNPYLMIVDNSLASASLSKEDGPYIVIAGSGMCDAGRVRNHLREGLGNKNTIVCLIGYMSRESLGRKLQEGFPIVNMNEEEIIIKAKIVSFGSFSAHADSNFLLSYTKKAMTKDSHADTSVFIVHGEDKGSASLKLQFIKTSISRNNGENILIPNLNQTIKIL